MGTHILPKIGKWNIYNYKNPDPLTMGWEYEIDPSFIYQENGFDDEEDLNWYKEHEDNTSDLKNRIKRVSKFKKEIEKALNKIGEDFAWCTEGLGTTEGYEIKSPVAPLRKFKTLQRKFLPTIKKYSPSKTENINDGGIHVNISINTYTKEREKRVFSFLHDEYYREFFMELSERDETSFYEYSPQNGLDLDGYNYRDHYGIITKSKNYAYELRLFKAKPHLLMPALEFADALYKCSTSKDLTPESLIEFTQTRHIYSSITPLMKKALRA